MRDDRPACKDYAETKGRRTMDDAAKCKVLILTVGLPRSGKSTWAKSTGHPIVSPDAIRLAMHGKVFLSEAEPWVWAMAYTMVSALFHAGHSVVVVDATNITCKRREEWCLRFPGVHVECMIFCTSEKECTRRAVATQRVELIPIIHRMAMDWDLEGVLKLDVEGDLKLDDGGPMRVAIERTRMLQRSSK